MKVKLKKTQDGMYADYYRLKDKDAFRKKTLSRIIEMPEKHLVFIIDTNRAARKLEEDSVKAFFEQSGLEYEILGIKNTRRSLLGLDFLFRRKKAKEKENLIIFRMNKGQACDGLYSKFLKHYDYGIIFDTDKSISDLINMYLSAEHEILFNKQEFGITFYDSILFLRLRTDSASDEVYNHLMEICEEF